MKIVRQVAILSQLAQKVVSSRAVQKNMYSKQKFCDCHFLRQLVAVSVSSGKAEFNVFKYLWDALARAYIPLSHRVPPPDDELFMQQLRAKHWLELPPGGGTFFQFDTSWNMQITPQG